MSKIGGSKIFPQKTVREKTLNSQEQREYYRLDMEHLPSLDATLISKNGANIDLGVLNISAGGLVRQDSPTQSHFSKISG